MDGMSKEEKHQLEFDAMENICEKLIPAEYRFASSELKQLFMEYENKSSPEARFVKDVDKYELVLQTFEYEKSGQVGRLDHFTESSLQIVHPTVRTWCEEVLEARRQWWTQQTGSVSSQM